MKQQTNVPTLETIALKHIGGGALSSLNPSAVQVGSGPPQKKKRPTKEAGGADLITSASSPPRGRRSMASLRARDGDRTWGACRLWCSWTIL